MSQSRDSFQSRSTLNVGDKSFTYYRLGALAEQGVGDIASLPYSTRVLLENLLRYEDGSSVKADDISTVASLVGHASMQTTQRYDRRGERAKQAAMQAIAIPYTGRKTAAARIVKAVSDLEQLHAARVARLRKQA